MDTSKDVINKNETVDVADACSEFAVRMNHFIDFMVELNGQEVFPVIPADWFKEFKSCVNSVAPSSPIVIFRFVFQCLLMRASNGARCVTVSQLQGCLADIIDLVVRKNRDYGNSAFNIPALVPWLPQSAAILVRLSDKISRVKNLWGKESATLDSPMGVPSETLFDTLSDMVGYLMLLWAVGR